MSFSSQIIADSMSPDGFRLTTFLVTYPRIIHAEHLRHRMMSFSVSSSRAIPISKIIKQVKENPYIPFHWGAQEPGMQANFEIANKEEAIKKWLESRDVAICIAESLKDLGLHKQVVNRILEPYMWVTVLVSATTFSNFFKLRCHPAAEPNIRKIAEMMRSDYLNSKPELKKLDQWHLPFIKPEEDYSIDTLKKLSTARCARTSYLNHLGTFEIDKDIELHKKLAESGHYSPMEHLAQVRPGSHGNFIGWRQYRQEFIGESGQN